MRISLFVFSLIVVCFPSMISSSGKSFLVDSSEAKGVKSRNQVREELGELLKKALEQQAQLSLVIGTFLQKQSEVISHMTHAAHSLLSDDAPYNTMTTKRLKVSVEEAEKNIKKMNAYIDHIQSLCVQLQKCTKGDVVV